MPLGDKLWRWFIKTAFTKLTHDDRHQYPCKFFSVLIVSFSSIVTTAVAVVVSTYYFFITDCSQEVFRFVDAKITWMKTFT